MIMKQFKALQHISNEKRTKSKKVSQNNTIQTDKTQNNTTQNNTTVDLFCDPGSVPPYVPGVDLYRDPGEQQVGDIQ